MDTRHHTFVSAVLAVHTIGQSAQEVDLRKTPQETDLGSPEQDSWDPRNWKQVPDTESKWGLPTGPTDSSPQWKGMLRGGPGQDTSLCLVLECFIKKCKGWYERILGEICQSTKQLGKKRFPGI